MRGLIEQRDWALATADGIAQLAAESEQLERQLAEHVASLGTGWSEERLAAIDVSPQAGARIVTGARRYQQSFARLGRLRSRYKATARVCKKRLAELNARQKALGGLPLEQAIETCKTRLTSLQDFGRLQLREAQLDEQQQGVHRRLASITQHSTLPRWVFSFLLFLLFGGSMIAAAGFYSGLVSNGFAGTALALVGLTGLGVGWGMKQQLDATTSATLERLRTEAGEIDVRVRETRQAMETLKRDPLLLSPPNVSAADAGSPAKSDATPDASVTAAADPALASCAGLIAKTVEQLADLELSSRVAGWLHAKRRRQSELHNRMHSVHCELSEHRQQWCQALIAIGLEETIHIDEAVARWQAVATAADTQRKLSLVRSRLGQQRQMLDAFTGRLARFGLPPNGNDVNPSDLRGVLDAWSAAVDLSGKNHALWKSLTRQSHALRREAKRNRRETRVLWTKRAALLVKGGATNRRDFQKRADAVEQRRQLEQALATAQDELAHVASTEPDLAIVEEDLLIYNPEDNRQCVEVLESEQADLQTDLEQACQQLGAVNQSLAELEKDCQSTQLRFERARLQEEIAARAGEWLAVSMARRAIDHVRGNFQRTRQPPVLAAASTYLGQFTSGRYRNVWTPLGQRHLRIDDEQGGSWRMEELSNGTREQLFLAICLAIVAEFRQKGMQLPMVLDDILVNFDEERTAAAIDTLKAFADGGQQVLLFTCHLHLAHLCESRGVAPIWLPSHQAPGEQRRIAG